AYYKYTNFFVANVSALTGISFAVRAIILPLGISFFTFTQIAFLVDVWRGIVRERSFIHYLLFVTYFPHLIAGPILHHAEMMPQFGIPATYRINPDTIAVGIIVFLLGLSNTLLIAGSLREYADALSNSASTGFAPQFVCASL